VWHEPIDGSPDRCGAVAGQFPAYCSGRRSPGRLGTSDVSAGSTVGQSLALPDENVQWLGNGLIFPSSASGVWNLERWRAASRTTEVISPSAGLPQLVRDGSKIAFFDYDATVMWKAEAHGRSRTRLGHEATR
jgi:hypothetical protein